jgi:nitroreductase
MKVSEALVSRISTRAFLDRPVSDALLRELLQGAGQAPSGGNLQPWFTWVLNGPAMNGFLAHMERRMAASPFGEKTEYDVYPPKLKDPYRGRRYACGEALYATLGVPREDKAGRMRQFARNYRFFDAPAALFFSIDRDMGRNQWAHVCMYMQSIMLLAAEMGLATCAQEAWALWHRSVGEFIGLPKEHMLYCGMAIGYADPEAPVNRLRTERAGLGEVVRFVPPRG